MVQVDVFWSYGLGAGFAFANTRQIRKEQKEGRSPYDHRSFRDTLLFLATIFAPSGTCLLWAFPSWETMHVGDQNMPAWLVTLFAVTNITQGILGYAIVSALIRKERYYLAYLQWAFGYLAMFFILVHGWDGTGYIRFFSETKEQIPGWTWATASAWLKCNVALTLYGMGVFLIPAMLHMMGPALKNGYTSSEDVRPENAQKLRASFLGGSVVLFAISGVLGSAIGASLLIRALGPYLGAPASVLIIWFLGLRRGGLYYRHYRQLLFAVPFFAPDPKAPLVAPMATPSSG